MHTTHTPGPWTATPGVHPSVWLIDSSKDGAITEVRPIRDSATNEANANMIAAAPELLAALEWVIDCNAVMDKACRVAALAAIAKAKGQS